MDVRDRVHHIDGVQYYRLGFSKGNTQRDGLHVPIFKDGLL